MTYPGGAPYGGSVGSAQYDDAGHPDWDAMAAAHERSQKRTRLVKLGIGAGAVLVVGGIVAAAMALQGRPAPRPAATATGAAPSASAGSAEADGPLQVADAHGAHPLTVESAAAVGQSDGHTGPTLILGGSPGAFAQTSAAVVDTNRSFTVSAMVRNDAPAVARTAVSQGNGSYYAFSLSRDYWGTHNQWAFKVQTEAGDSDNTVKEAMSQSTATVGRWTLLTGVYDASAKSISLYVDGTLAQTTPVKGIWQTTGPLQVGRTRYHSAWVDSWTGALGDVQVWSQALSASDVARLSASGGTSAGVPAIASWLLP